jgi:hypothetical protein
MQMMEVYLITMLEGCLRAKMPQTIEYGLLIEESCKVLLTYILIIKFQQPLIGALLSLTTAFTTQNAYYLKLLSKELKQPIARALKSWASLQHSCEKRGEHTKFQMYHLKILENV